MHNVTELKEGTVIIADPGIITDIQIDYNSRFDVLKHVKTIIDKNSKYNEFIIKYPKGSAIFDNFERLWVMIVDYDCNVEFDTIEYIIIEGINVNSIHYYFNWIKNNCRITIENSEKEYIIHDGVFEWENGCSLIEYRKQKKQINNIKK